VRCIDCGAPHTFLYFNDGKKRTQLRCKVCYALFVIAKRYRLSRKTKYWCPYCEYALYKWKEEALCTIYKCGNDKCTLYLKRKTELTDNEQKIQKQKSSQFKLRYQYREYHFEPEQLTIAPPIKPKIELHNIHKSSRVVGLILAFHISLAITARKTAYLMKAIFQINISYQTVLNYAEAAAYYCHQFNITHKGMPHDTNCGDETYIKIAGQRAYAFFFLSNHKVTAYNIDFSRDVLPATASMVEASRNATQQQHLTFITDGNPAYTAAILFMNNKKLTHNPLTLKQVIGLQNLDQTSEEFRPFKQIIERFNRTYKSHVKYAAGFNSRNGAMAYTTLFVTHYNFLRPHMSLKFKTPINIPELNHIPTLQDKWIKILSMAAS
jgi:transposase-like protein